ncbi:FAD-dependent oxidoreductase [Kitasatospora sp. NPDC001660]
MRSHVVVIGGGLAGTLAAAAAAPYVDRVTVVERDVLPAGPVPRRGTPQARHAHHLWSGGCRAVEDLLPGITERWIAAGARRVNLPDGWMMLAGHVWVRRFPGRHYSIACSRDLLDWVMREQVLAGPGIALRAGTQALGLTGDRTRVAGVRVRDERTGAEGVLEADLVVDAAGRGSRAPQWLGRLGLPAVAEDRVDWTAGFASCLFRAPADTAAAPPIVMLQPDFCASGPLRAANLVTVEDGQWMVTLMGTRGDEPGAQRQRFAQFARQVRDPLVADLIDRAEPVGPVHTMRAVHWRRRHFGRTGNWPDGLVVLGDAAANYNPVLSQGMSVAAQSAVALRDGLRRGWRPGSARQVQRSVARLVRDAWTVGTVMDPLWLDADPGPALRLYRRGFERLVAASNERPAAAEAMFDVLSTSSPVSRLLVPGILLAALRGGRTDPGP